MSKVNLNKKPIKGYEGFYEIDQDGNIFSVDRFIPNKFGVPIFYKGKKRKPIAYQTGYFGVSLAKDGIIRQFRLHRLIAENLIFNIDPINKIYVNHIDGNKENNHPSNLEWVTPKENTKHAIETGLINSKGVNNASCKHSIEDVKQWIIMLYNKVKIEDIMKKYNCNRNTISKLIKIHFPGTLGKYNGNHKIRTINLQSELETLHFSTTVINS